MRDHPHHDTSVLGGLWGIKLTNKTIQEKFAGSFRKLLTDPLAQSQRDMHGPDQSALTKYFWYVIETNIFSTLI